MPALELSQKFEREFFRDLTALGVEPPSTVLRVSEHIDEVLSPCSKAKESARMQLTSALPFVQRCPGGAVHPKAGERWGGLRHAVGGLF